MKRTQSQLRHLLKKTGLYRFNSNKVFVTPYGTYTGFEVKEAVQTLLNVLGTVEYNPDNRLDDESGLPHTLHEACNSLMFYTLEERGILKQSQVLDQERNHE